MKIRLAVSKERYSELRAALESYGIEIDDTADLILCEDNPFVDSLIVRDKETGEKVVVSVDDIVFVESCGHSIEVHSTKGLYLSSGRLYKIYNILDQSKFIRISNSVIIAKNKVIKIASKRKNFKKLENWNFKFVSSGEAIKSIKVAGIIKQ